MVQNRKGQLPHVEWLELKNDGTFNECVVMKRDANGNIYYFQINELDTIDKKRLSRILHGRHAAEMELWDVMSQVTLNNGVNALTYFHQLVKVVTPSGMTYTPRTGMIGGPGTGGIKMEKGRVQMKQPPAKTVVVESVRTATAKLAKKKAGRPKKKVAVVETAATA